MSYDLDYDLVFECCGERWFVKRSMALLKRLEQAFGPIDPLSRRLDSGHVTSIELVLAYHLLLHGEAHAPSRQDIEAWIGEQGIHKPSRAISGQVFSLIMGNEELARMAAAEEAKAARRRSEAQTPGPFDLTGAPTSATGSPPPT